MTRHPKLSHAVTAGLVGIAFMFPSAAFWQSARESNAQKDTFEQQAKDAKLAAQQSAALNEQLQTRLSCRSGLAQAIDVAIGSILVKITAGGPSDLTPERVALQKALEERAQTAERCG